MSRTLSDGARNGTHTHTKTQKNRCDWKWKYNFSCIFRIYIRFVYNLYEQLIYWKCVIFYWPWKTCTEYPAHFRSPFFFAFSLVVTIFHNEIKTWNFRTKLKTYRGLVLFYWPLFIWRAFYFSWHHNWWKAWLLWKISVEKKIMPGK